MDQDSRLLQHKRDVIAALGQKNYEAALRALEDGLVVAPADPLLLELHGTIKTVKPAEGKNTLVHTSDTDSSVVTHDEDRDSDAESLEATSSTEADSDTEVQESESDDADQTTDCAPCGPSCSICDCLHTDTAEAELNKSQSMQKEQLSDSSSHQLPSAPAPLAGIKLAASCCTLTHQRRTEMKQLLLNSQEQQRADLVKQQLMQYDPLLTC